MTFTPKDSVVSMFVPPFSWWSGGLPWQVTVIEAMLKAKLLLTMLRWNPLVVVNLVIVNSSMDDARVLPYTCYLLERCEECSSSGFQFFLMFWSDWELVSDSSGKSLISKNEVVFLSNQQGTVQTFCEFECLFRGVLS